MERARDRWGDNPERAFAIVNAQSGRLLGSVTRHGPYGHRASFGYWLAPEARGRGAATRALHLITEWTLQTTDAIRLDLYTMVGNDASRGLRSAPATSARRCFTRGISTGMGGR